MSTDDNLASMIRSCVDHEVRDVALPGGFAERVVRNAREGRRPKRFAVGMAALATATAVVAVPVSSRLLIGAAPAAPGQGPAVIEPRELEGRVAVTVPPPGTRRFVQVREPQDAKNGLSVWTTAYLLDGRPRGYVWIRVISGNVALEDVAADHYAPSGAGGLEKVPVARGEARAWRNGGQQHVVLQSEPGLVVVVRALNMSREDAVRIAEGVRVR